LVNGGDEGLRGRRPERSVRGTREIWRAAAARGGAAHW